MILVGQYKIYNLAKLFWQTIISNYWGVIGDPDHDHVLRTKTWSCTKRLGPHDLVIPVPGLGNRVFYLVLGPGHQSLTAGGKNVPILQLLYENTFLCMLSARHKVQN